MVNYVANEAAELQNAKVDRFPVARKGFIIRVVSVSRQIVT